MTTPLTHNQLQQLSSLGISPAPPPPKPPKLFPLLSISGLTAISIGGLVLFKNKTDTASSPPPPTINHQPSLINDPSPTQVPKSIQHYLLASQQYFNQAFQAQQVNTADPQIPNLLNQSLTTATTAIREFPTDYRGFYQRSRIYQSLLASQPQFISQAITDLASASRLNPTSADLTRELATLYAKTGDTQNTLNYLAQTVTLEPTKAQNFYDLAKLQQQVGLLPSALDTYNRLIPLITDLTQKQQVETEVASLKKLVAQTSPAEEESAQADSYISPSSGISPTPIIDTPLLQASTTSSVVIAAPETRPDIQVKDQTTTNALSGTATLPANQTQITLENSNINSTSKLYLTITYGGKNQNLQVLSKTAGSATIGLSAPITEDIQFKWWIINP